MTTQESMGLKIKSLRENRQLSQSELAALVGYKDKTAIAKVESGKVDLPQSKISAFVKALNTTTSYLFSDTVDGYSENTNDFEDETAQIAHEIAENKDLRLLFDAARTASSDDLLALQAMLLALKKKEHGEND